MNDAMATVFAELPEPAPEDFRRATEVTYLGLVWRTRAALGRMLPRDRGTILQMGSALAYRGIPLHAPYCGAKHAAKGLSRTGYDSQQLTKERSIQLWATRHRRALAAAGLRGR